MPDHILEMVGITKKFPGVTALDDVSLSVVRGEIHAICGENGAGKSTLMKVLSGVIPHGIYTGEIRYEGAEVHFRDIRSSERAGIVIIHQELALIPELSITENLFLGNEPTRFGVIDWAEAHRRAAELMASVGLQADPRAAIKDIGVGRQQLVEIAKAVNKNVRLLILDEPTAALDAISESRVALGLDTQRRGMTTIIITHRAELAARADRVITLEKGQLTPQ